MDAMEILKDNLVVRCAFCANNGCHQELSFLVRQESKVVVYVHACPICEERVETQATDR